MKKDFDSWNKIKKAVNYRKEINNIFLKERDVWWCMLGINIGDEQDGKGDRAQRPVLIVKKFNQRVFFGVPLTTVIKNNKYYYQIKSPDKLTRSVILSQTRLLDSRRLTEKMFSVLEVDYLNIKKAIRDLFS